jgi:uncharacterized repeat protein (TIGR02543 family)
MGLHVEYYGPEPTVMVTVTFDAIGGTGGTTSVAATYGSAMPSITVPTRTGYTFGGYWTGTNGSGTQYYTASGASARTWDKTSATTLYAKWTILLAVTDVAAQMQNPLNGLMDITCRVTGINGTTNGLYFYVAAVNQDSGDVLNISNFWVVQGGTNSTDREVHSNGTYWLVWDAWTDLGPGIRSNMVVRVAIAGAHRKFQLWEGGPYWAETNIGAEEPWERGYYFWWGDIVGYRRKNNAWVSNDGSTTSFSFTSENTPTYGKDISTLQSEGWITADSVLAPEHDAARVQWGGVWRMPTDQEVIDLNSKCDWTWTQLNGINGYVVKGKDAYASVSIFLPATGYGTGTSHYSENSNGDYWTSVSRSDNDYALGLGFTSYALYTNNNGRNRYYGQPVRPVQGSDSVPDGLSGDSASMVIDLRAAPFVVTLDQEGGSGGTESVTATYGSAMPSITVPTRTGYTFGGYYTSSGGGGTQYYTASGASARTWDKTSATTLYAKWTAVSTTYTVTLDQQGGSGGTSSVTATYGSAMPSITVPTRTGYTFGGYWTGKNGSGTQYYTASGASARTWDKTSATTLYAKWTAKTYTVTLDQQSGSGGTASVTATYGNAMPTITVPTRTGYTFGGYYTSSGGGGTQYYTASGASARTWDKTSATTLYAKWTANTYTVTFDPNGGSVSETAREVSGGAAAGELPSPVRTGYIFAGWWTAAVGGTKISASTVVTSDVTYYAQWERVELPVITPGDGAVFHTDTCTVTITCATPGAVIYYSSNGRTPTATARYLYSGPFTISGTATVTAFAVKDGVQSDYVDATITYAIPEVLTLKGVLDEPKLGEVTTGGDAEWAPVEDASAKIGGSCAVSGEVPDDDDAVYSSWLKTKVVGKGTLSFWWRVDCEPDPRGRFTYDYGSVAIDGTVAARKDGTTEWMNFSVTFDTEGEHEIVWKYVSDGYPVEDGEYAGRMWVDGVSWSGSVATDSLPAVASDAEVASALEGTTDARLVEYIKTAAQYNAFRNWVDSKGLDHQAVKESPRAWLSYALDAEGLVDHKFEKGDVVIVSLQTVSTNAFSFEVEIKDVPIGSSAKAEELATIFEVLGAPTLSGHLFSVANVDATLGVAENGKLLVQAKSNLGTGSLFVRVRMHADDDDWRVVTVTYSPGANGSGMQQAATKTYGVSLTLKGATFTRSGYTQTGWATSDGGAKVYDLGAAYTANAAITLYPFWTANTYTVTYKPGTNGSGTQQTATKTYGVSLALKGATFMRSGYMQTGWATCDGGAKAYDLGASYDANAAITLYPFWTANSSTDTHAKVQLWEGGPYWATTNIGAEKPEDYGYYFWWGDTMGYKLESNKWVASDDSAANYSFSYGNAPTYNKSITTLQSEEWITADEVLAPEHDAAHVHWGGNWRMPTNQELADLVSKCNWTWTKVNNVQGYAVRGKGDYAANSIFLPCAGYGWGTSLYDAGSRGYYWSSIPHSDDSRLAWGLLFNSGYHDSYNIDRYPGRPVRPVQDDGGTANTY